MCPLFAHIYIFFLHHLIDGLILVCAYVNNAVFKYPPTGNSTVVPSVYLLPNMWSYTTCEFRGAKLLGSADQGGGEGIKIELNQLKPYYFASDEGNAYDCIAGLTKFIAVPSTRSF